MRHIISRILITSIFFVFLYPSFSFCAEKKIFVSDCYMKGRLQFEELIKFEFMIYFHSIKSDYLIP